MRRVAIQTCMLLAGSSLLVSGVGAQDEGAPAGAPRNSGVPDARRGGAARGPRILEVDNNQIRALEGLAGRNDVDAVSLNLTRARLRASVTAQQSLGRWVREGGVVFLHTDAAQMFGYRTVAARTTTNRMAGQLFGRARAALSFGSHPLLWGTAGERSGRGGAGADGGGNAGERGGQRPGALGVRTVFYQLNEGDHLVVGHPAGVPLLRVTDLASSARAQLLAAAIAPYGRGWAVFTPALVEQHRGDGPVFLQNLLRLVGSSVKATGRAPEGSTGQASAGETLTSFPAALLERAATALGRARTEEVDYAAIAQDFTRALQPINYDNGTADGEDAAGPNAPDANANAAAPNGTRVTLVAATTPGTAAPTTPGPTANATAANARLLEPRLMLAQEEADRGVRLLNGAHTNAAWRPYAAALVYMLRARLELQRDNVRDALAWFKRANDLRPDTAESLLWRGIIAAGQAEDVTLNSPARASLLGNAATNWRDALTAEPLVRRSDATGANAGGANANSEGNAQGGATNNRAGGNISGVPHELIRAWGAAAAFSANIMRVEPPLGRLLGGAGSGMVLRHFAGDPTVRLAIPAGDVAARSTGALGWHADEEELLIFPSEQYYTAYRRAAGLGSQTVPNPAGAFGDIVGSRIMMMSQSSMQVILPPARPGGPPRFVQLGTSVVPVVARMHAYVLINALAGGGTEVPGWMQLGIVGLTNVRLVSDLSGGNAGGNSVQNLRQFAAAGALLRPEQFQAALAPGGANGGASGNTTGLPEDQGMSLMYFFYERFGQGRVVETLQRLGSGASVDDALTATTGMNEEQFFRAWYNAYFG